MMTEHIVLETLNAPRDNPNVLCFRLSGVNRSLANALRRTILSDIPTVVFKTAPYNPVNPHIFTNTSRLKNEVLNQRISCIPVHVTNLSEFRVEDYYVEVHVQNDTPTIQYVTTEHFKVKRTEGDEELSPEEKQQLGGFFLPNLLTHDYIDLARLRPAVGELPGEQLHFTCGFHLGTAKEDGAYNVVSTCSYENTVNLEAQRIALEAQIQHWREEDGKTEEEIQEFDLPNWKLLEGLRFFKPNSFDFVVESVGVFENRDIVTKACNILIDKLQRLEYTIESYANKIPFCYNLVLVNEDYTIGKILEYLCHTLYFESIPRTMTFCGFKKMHPHDDFGILRVAYVADVPRDAVQRDMDRCKSQAIEIFAHIGAAITEV